MVLIVPMYEEDQVGVYYNTAAVIDADGKYLGKYRKTHIPHVNGFWEKFYFRPGNMGYPVFDTAVGKVGVYICYDRHFPEGARMLGLHGAELVFIPSATSRGLSMHLWFIEQTAHAIANGYWVGTINRVGTEKEFGPNEYYGSSYFADPRGKIIAQASEKEEQLLVADLNMDLVREVRNTWQFYRDRRPDMYDDMVKP
jgi:N-carbamoylputrescine amidase